MKSACHLKLTRFAYMKMFGKESDQRLYLKYFIWIRKKAIILNEKVQSEGGQET